MRTEDIYLQIKTTNEKFKYLPPQSLLPDDIYGAMRRAIIWICTENNALFDSEEITIITDVTDYVLTKTFKSIKKLVNPDGTYEMIYRRPEDQKFYKEDLYSYTFLNDTIKFFTKQNNYVGEKFTCYGYIMPSGELNSTTEIPISKDWDEVIFLKAMSLIVPIDTNAHQIYRAEAMDLSRLIGGKNNYMRDMSYQSNMDW